MRPLDFAAETQDLTQAEAAFLQTIIGQMGIVADVSRADILIYSSKSAEAFKILAHALPHSLAHVYNTDRTGHLIPTSHRPEVLVTLNEGVSHKPQRSVIAEGAPVVRQTMPIFFPPPHEAKQNGTRPRVIAALIIVTNLIEYERQRLRSSLFQQVLRQLQNMLLAGQVTGAELLSPFGEQDGILYVDDNGIIRYASGIADNLFRRVGYKETLVGRYLNQLETGDDDFRHEVLARQSCFEAQQEENQRYWVRRGIPITPFVHWDWKNPLTWVKPGASGGLLILLRDDTEARRQDQELRIKNAMIQEVHHRVKNNLQTIAALLRMQARRVESIEARLVLEETLSRILSVAVIHEFLSTESTNIINIKEVSSRIISQFQQGLLSPEKQIHLELSGKAVYLPARQATACSLIINELLQNAVEHGFEKKQTGVIKLCLDDDGDEVMITVSDNGDGVPEDFTLDQSTSLGLQIVKILVEGDLHGQIEIVRGTADMPGLSITITFPKTFFSGEEGWVED